MCADRSLRQHLAESERSYWVGLLARYPDKRLAARVAGVGLATLYRRAPKHLFPPPPVADPVGERRKRRPPTKVRGLIIRPFRRDHASVPGLFKAFGVPMSQERWRLLHRRGKVRELEGLYELAHARYRVYMRRCHPDVAPGARVDAGAVNALWTRLKVHIRRAMREIGAEM